MVVNSNLGTIAKVTVDASGHYNKGQTDAKKHIVVGRNNVGLVAATNSGTISQCTVKGRITASWNGGFIAGRMDDGSINNCHVVRQYTELFFIFNQIGGLVGTLNGGTIENNLVESTIYTGSAGSNVGGLVGAQNGGIIQHNAMNAVKIFSYGGGLITKMGTIAGSSSAGTVANNWQSSTTIMQTSKAGAYPTDGVFSHLSGTHSDLVAGTVGVLSTWDFTKVWALSSTGPCLQASLLP
jgi:hypothetical protein